MFPYGWGGWNRTGWRDDVFDAACLAAQASVPGEDAYADGHTQAGRIFAEQLPAIPLFYTQEHILLRADLCGVSFSESGFFWSAPDWVDCP